MARIVVEDKLVAALAPEMAGRIVKPSRREIDILQQAMVICEKAGELQATINSIEGVPESQNDFEWARIYLAYCLAMYSASKP